MSVFYYFDGFEAILLIKSKCTNKKQSTQSTHLSTFTVMAALHAYVGATVQLLLTRVTAREHILRAWRQRLLLATRTRSQLSPWTFATVTRVTSDLASMQATSKRFATNLSKYQTYQLFLLLCLEND